jgi:hypothetical protein
LSSRLIFITDYGRLSALSATPHTVLPDGSSGYISPLQRELEERLASPDVSRVSRRVTLTVKVSIGDSGETKLQYQYNITDISTVQSVQLNCDISIKEKLLFNF